MHIVGRSDLSPIYPLEWELTCGSLGEDSTATFRVQVDTLQEFSTYDVELVSQWTTSSVAASEEEGLFQVGVGRGQVFRDLSVGEEHDLSVSNAYDTAGDHQTKFTALIHTGNWAFPDDHQFPSGDNVISVSRRECTSGPTGATLIASGNIEETSPASSAFSHSPALGGVVILAIAALFL